MLMNIRDSRYYTPFLLLSEIHILHYSKWGEGTLFSSSALGKWGSWECHIVSLLGNITSSLWNTDVPEPEHTIQKIQKPQLYSWLSLFFFCPTYKWNAELWNISLLIFHGLLEEKECYQMKPENIPRFHFRSVVEPKGFGIETMYFYGWFTSQKSFQCKKLFSLPVATAVHLMHFCLT